MDGNSYHTIAEGLSTNPFLLNDETGVFRVLPAGADLFLHNDTRHENPLVIVEGCKRLGRVVPRQLERIRCWECHLLPGEKACVLGTVKRNPLMQATASPEESLFIGKDGKSRLIIADEGKNTLLAELSLKLVMMMFGGPALVVVCLYLLSTASAK